jgi:hypothetical protein
LATAEKTGVVFDADLRPSPVPNWATLNGAFAASLKAATLKVAALRALLFGKKSILAISH